MFHTNINYSYFLKSQQNKLNSLQDLQKTLTILTKDTKEKKNLLLNFFIFTKQIHVCKKANKVFLFFFFLLKTSNVICLQSQKQTGAGYVVGFLQNPKTAGAAFGNVFNFCSILSTKIKHNTFVVFNKVLLVSPRYNSSSVNKHISNCVVKDIEFQFLRKNKVFNKGRYSRCRQNYRTGVYLCMYLSVVCIFGMYFWFYKFSFNFTYLWWVFIAFFGSFFIPKIIKYRLYEPNVIFSKFYGLFFWVSKVIKSICG